MLPLILDTGEVIRAEDPTLRGLGAFELDHLHRRARRILRDALRPSPCETDGHRYAHLPRMPLRVTGRRP